MTADALLTDGLDLRPRTTLVTGDELVGQRVRLRLQQAEGDWVLNASHGLPWLDWLTTKPFPQDVALARIRQEIEAVPGVQQVQTLAMTRSGTTATITGDLLTASGVVPLVVAVGGGGVTQSFAAAPWVLRATC